MTFIPELHPKTHFHSHRDRIEQAIAQSILELGDKTKLRDACEYSLRGGGKRFRPLLVLLVAEALGNNWPIMAAAVSVEYFHTASLIVDDLPCMDNEDERRNSPTVHKVYGESIALLASYALICAAFDKIKVSILKMKEEVSSENEECDRRGIIVLGQATRNAGILGATGGQFYDLFPPHLTLESLKQVVYQKTIALFEVAFVFGWLFGGGEISRLDRVKQSAYHFGMSFQIADDLEDIFQDEKNQREINFAKHIGKDRAFALFEDELKLFKLSLLELSLDTPSFKKLHDMLHELALKNFTSLNFH